MGQGRPEADSRGARFSEPDLRDRSRVAIPPVAQEAARPHFLWRRQALRRWNSPQDQDGGEGSIWNRFRGADPESAATIRRGNMARAGEPRTLSLASSLPDVRR